MVCVCVLCMSVVCGRENTGWCVGNVALRHEVSPKGERDSGLCH